MNGFLLIDKEAGFTSHDVVACVRGIMGEKRVGHTGTLDPMATGLLVVLLGRATRAVSILENDDKEYAASIKFGIETDTQDITGNVIRTSFDVPDKEKIKEAVLSFKGETEQTPPMYSAVKVGGKKLYELARKGEVVEREKRKVTVSSIEIDKIDGDECHIRVCCSKGTYIRTLAHDIGQKLGCGAALNGLRRLRCGDFTLDSAVTLTALRELLEKSPAEEVLSPTDMLFEKYEKIEAKSADEVKIKNGLDIFAPETISAGGFFRVYSESGEFLMLAQACNEGETVMLKCVKSFFEV